MSTDASVAASVAAASAPVAETAPADSSARLRPWPAILAVLATVCAGVAVSYGLARDDRLWLLVGAVVFAPVLVASTHGASNAVLESRRAAGAAGCAGLALLFVVVTVIVEPWWGEPTTAHGPALVIGASDPSAHVYLRRVPGGGELNRKGDPDPLVANTAYRFRCQVRIADGTVWLRQAEADYWAPATAMLTKGGQPPPRLPVC
jgi:hypothetical protein